MERVRFRKGEQRKFLNEVLRRVNCPSLRAFLQFGFDIPYSTLKNYYSELRLLPKSFFEELSSFSGIRKESYVVEFLEENWGKIKGGKKRRS
jgi:hypothetical protein